MLGEEIRWERRGDRHRAAAASDLTQTATNFSLTRRVRRRRRRKMAITAAARIMAAAPEEREGRRRGEGLTGTF